MVKVRRLQKQDFNNGFLETLENLTEVGDVSRAMFEQQFLEIDSNPAYDILVAEIGGQVAGSITILWEKKFIHECGTVAHIEDVVTRNGFQGRGVARQLMVTALSLAKQRDCYKVILDCSKKLVPFYEKFGFVKKEHQMRLDL